MLSKYLAPVSGTSAVKYGSAALGTAIVTWGLWALWRRRHDNSRLPPGPRRGFFSSGPAPDDIRTIEATFMNYVQEYGDVFSFQSGSNWTVVLASCSAIKEAFVKQGEDFSCRPLNTTGLNNVLGMRDDIFGAAYQSKGFNKNRTEVIGCLRSAGFGQANIIEERIILELECLTEYLTKESDGNAEINLHEILPKVTLNVIYNIEFSKRFNFDDPKHTEILNLLRDMLQSFSYSFVLERFPLWFAKIWHRKIYLFIKETMISIRKIVELEIDNHIASFDPNNSRDFVDNYIRDIGASDKLRFVDNCLTLMPDAVDTVALCVEWAILYLTLHPDILQRVVSEIEGLTDGNRQVRWSDRNMLPYTEATIREVIRLYTPMPITAQHAVFRDVSFRGYTVPANAVVYAFIYGALRDPKVFAEPEKFSPERYFDKEGQVIRSDTWMPFSLGPRKCPGEPITQMEVFLMVSNLVQYFSFEFPPGDPPTLESCKDDFIRRPQPFRLIMNRKVQ